MDSLNVTFTALSDPTRRQLLKQLQRGPATVLQLAEPFGLSQQAISKHLAYLEKANLIEKRKEGRQHFCSLNPLPLKLAHDWIDEYQGFWNEAFDRLEVFLKNSEAKKKTQKKNKNKKKR